MVNVEDGDEFGTIRVREKDGRFRRVHTPSGYTDELFRAAVTAFDTAYRLSGTTPTLDEVYRIWPRIDKKVYSALFLTEEFKQALAYRGVEWEPETAGISSEQSYAILLVSNPSDRRSRAVKLRELGISEAKWQAWMRQPLFAEVFRRRSEHNLSDAIPVAINALVGNAESGDHQAIKLLLEMTGRWDPSTKALEDARTVVMAMVEAIIQHTTPEIRERILSAVQMKAAMLTLMPSAGGEISGGNHD